MDAVATPQPPPAKHGGREVLPDLVAHLRARSDFGARKYGVRLHTENGRDAYVDALQELLDLFVYLHQAQMEHAATLAELDSERSTREELDAQIARLKAELEAARANFLGARDARDAALLEADRLRRELALEVEARRHVEEQLGTRGG